MNTNPLISVRQITKAFGNVKAVDNVSLDIMPGDFFALLGPSGCGKTTLLRMIAGFESASDGQILLEGKDILDTPPNKRPINMVFQSYAVFPHMNVEKNVGYGLRVTGTPSHEIKERVAEALSLVKLNGYERRLPGQLSGGQRQRVALARALVKRPKVLLLDEPLSALDAKLREAMQLELVRLQKTVGITFIIVTHDQDEALSMANRIAVMESGHVRQIASPAELYEYPNSRFVAGFIGKLNLIEARIVGVGNGYVTVDALTGRADIPFNGQARGDIMVAVRPEKVRLTHQEPQQAPLKLLGKVRELAYYGDESHIYLEHESGLVMSANVPNESRDSRAGISLGDRLWASWNAADTLILTT